MRGRADRSRAAGWTQSSRSSVSPGAGGCNFVHDPDVPAGREPAIWLPELAPGVLTLTATPSGIDFDTIVNPATLGPRLAERGGANDRHVLIGDADQLFHIWIHGHEALRRPAVSLPLDETFVLRLAIAGRFYGYLRGRRPSPLPRTLQLTPFQRARLILLLHVYDFRQAGGGPRDIARSLIDADAAALPAIEWKSSAARRKANRLIQDATNLVDGGYLKLLRGD